MLYSESKDNLRGRDGLAIAKNFKIPREQLKTFVHNKGMGTESDDYLANSRCNGVYDLNTVVNYCPDTLSLLDSPPYSAFRRDENGEWINISYDVDWRYWA